MFISDTNLKPYKIHLSSNNFSSKFDNYNNYYFELNETIRKYNNMEMLIKLESFVFTNTIYNINDNNNNFNYSFYGPGLGAVFNVRVNNGNYSIDDLITNLNIRCTNDLQFSFNSSTLKITVVSLRENLNFRFVNVDKNIYKMLGFNEIITETLYNSITSPSIINLNPNTSLNIIFENINFQCNSVKNQSLNIFQSIPIISAFGEVQTFINTNDFKYIVDDDTINNIHLNIVNQDFEPVLFNNSNWYICISIEFMYKKELIMPKEYFNENTLLYNSLRDEALKYNLNIEKNINKKNNI
jgi:hypothetical protein